MNDVELMELITEEQANWPHTMTVTEQDLPDCTTYYGNVADLCTDLSDYDDEFVQIAVTVKLIWR